MLPAAPNRGEARVSGAWHPLVDGLPPDWAVEWGKDRHGVFVGFAVGDVVQRMRWVRPGTFRMGSPDREAGRMDGEGPQHDVTLTSGFWLADTPCTQELWEAVVGSNPSQFKTPKRPVENVSWMDCQEFLTALGAMVAGPGWRLPTEAEWEYACRAGATAATWVGDLTLRGENDAPELDAIAWYGGNSGHQLDIADGFSSTSWPQKQYPHTTAATRDVRTRDLNPWGLHDMLGNVWEWCSDWYDSYDATRQVEPNGPATGSGRVMRGGSWRVVAGTVRAAARAGRHPGYRSSACGFRLARGHQSSQSGSSLGRGEPGTGEHRRARDAPGGRR